MNVFVLSKRKKKAYYIKNIFDRSLIILITKLIVQNKLYLLYEQAIRII